MNKIELMSFFETGDIPTQSQFQQLISHLGGDAVAPYAFGMSAIYNGTGSYSVLENTYSLQSNGDYVQFKMKADSDLSGFRGLGMIGSEGTANTIGIGNADKFYIRDNTNAWLTTSANAGVAVDGNYHVVKISYEENVIRIYVDDVLVQNNIPQGLVNIDRIGNAYAPSSPFFGQVTNIEISSSGVVTKIPCPHFASEFVERSIGTTAVNTGTGLLSESLLQTIKDNENTSDVVLDYLKNNNLTYTEFNGTSSLVNLPQTYILDADGDFVEMVVRTRSVTDFESLGVIGTGQGSANLIGFNDGVDLWIRQNNGTFVQWIGVSDFTTFRTIKVVVSGSNYELFIDGESKGTRAKTASTSFNNVGRGYNTNFAQIDIQGLEVSTASGNLSVINFAVEYNFVNGIALKQIPLPDLTELTEYAEGYVSLLPTGSADGQERWEVYTKLKGHTNKYVRFLIDHLTDNSDLLYYDVWRILGAALYTFDGQTMISEGTTLMSQGESEFVYQRTGRDDFSGGSTHGDEQLIFANFYIDKVKVTSAEMSAGITLQSCTSFHLAQKSTMHSASIGGVFIPGHPIENEHFKETYFENGKIINRSRVVWKQAIMDISICYGTLVSIAPAPAQKAYVKALEETEMNGANGTAYFSSTGQWIRYWNESNGLSCRIDSKFNIYENDSTEFVIKSATQHKYYRDMCRRGNRQLTVAVDDEFIMETTTQFDLEV